MNHTFETAANLLIKLSSIDRPAMTHEVQMIYDRAYFKGLLENLIVFVPEARDYIEKIYSREKQWKSTSAHYMTANWKRKFAKTSPRRHRNIRAQKIIREKTAKKTCQKSKNLLS